MLVLKLIHVCKRGHCENELFYPWSCRIMSRNIAVIYTIINFEAYILQCSTVSKTSPTHMLLSSITIISDVYRSFIPNKTIFTEYWFTLWITMLPRSFENITLVAASFSYNNVIKWKYFPRYWPFVRGIHRWIPRTKASDAELWCFLWSASE